MLPDELPEERAAVSGSPKDWVDPVIERYKKDVNRSLLRENLKLTVDERFCKFEEFMLYVHELREAGRKHRQQS